MDIERFEERVRKAKKALADAINKEFPVGQTVFITHHRGQFLAEVVKPASCHEPSYLWVRNNASGKASKRWWKDISH